MFHLNQFIFLKNQEISEQRRNKFVKRLSLNDFRNINEYNVNL